MKPSLTSAIEALRTTDPRYPWVKPTVEEDDIAAVLEVINNEHQGDRDDPDDTGHWGRCTTCGWKDWPCKDWIEGQMLAIEYLGKAADRVMRHSHWIGRVTPW